MKKYFLISTISLALIFAGCKEKPYINAPGETSKVPDSIPSLIDPDPTPAPEGFIVPEDAIDVYKAVEIGRKLKSGEITSERYLIKGWVVGFNRGETFAADFPKYGNDFVYISATSPYDSIQSKKTFYGYRLLGKYAAKLPDQECVKEGDFVIMSCFITNYSGTIESNGACFLTASNNEHFNTIYPFTYQGCRAVDEGEISVTEAEAISNQLKIDKPNDKYPTSDEAYNILGVVCSIDGLDESGRVSFNITDGSAVATCYQTYKGSATGKFTNLDQIQLGDTVVVNAKIENFGGTCEPYRGYVSESSNPNF